MADETKPAKEAQNEMLELLKVKWAKVNGEIWDLEIFRFTILF